ncbi:hypothetical protein Btru_067910, partial [Bulinus truncatus]
KGEATHNIHGSTTHLGQIMESHQHSGCWSRCTGTFIALYNIIRQAEETGCVDFFKTVSKLREDRICMVQTVSQYEFLHKAALVAIACMRTTLNIHDFSDRLKILEEMNPLRASKMELEFNGLCAVGLLKNKKTINFDDSNIYENAAKETTTAPGNIDQKEQSTIFEFLPGYKHKDQYVTAKLPILQQEAIELWETITQNNIQLLVAFEVDPVKETSTIYIPNVKDPQLIAPPFEIKLSEVSQTSMWEEKKLSIQFRKSANLLPHNQNDVISVTHLKCYPTKIEPKKWLEIAKKIRVCSSHTGGKMLFMCSDGVYSSGFMAVLSILLDRVDNESYFSVPMVVGAIRSLHPKILTSLKQYQLLYHIIKRHIETSAEYTNIEFTNYHNVNTLNTSSAQKDNENEINRTDQSETPKNDEEINKTDDRKNDLVTADDAILTSNPLNNNSWITDRDDMTCNLDPDLKSVTVTWQRAYPLTWVRINLADYTQLSSIILLYRLNTSSKLDTKCQIQTFSLLDNGTSEIRCKDNVEIQSMTISGNISSLCSLYISGGRNIAYKQTAAQSSTYSESINQQTIFFTADLAVDGNTDQMINDFSCAHTSPGDRTSSFYLTLQSAYLVNRFVIFNRECPPGKWSLPCTKQCNSSCPTSCHLDDGSCNSGCAGYSNPPECTDVCNIGKWGINCGNNCNNRCVDSFCDTKTGLCDSGCVGYIDPPYCVKGCEKGTYGRNCSLNCSTNCLDGLCEAVNGTCFKCQIGFDGDSCDRETQSPLNNVSTEYINILDTENTLIPIESLISYLASKDEDFYMKQFEKIPTAKHVTQEIGHRQENKQKNRYKNICPYDHSRVHLEINTEKNEEDYINASYIRGFNDKVNFIAAQGLQKASLIDFIRMLWEQKVDVVVMLTDLIEDGKVKCEKYWPDTDKIQVGHIQVKLGSIQMFADFTVRKLELSIKGEATHNITQFHYTSWPDKGVPSTQWSLIDVNQYVTAIVTDRPILVHCSGGDGRTDTFIALYNIIRQAEETGCVDFFKTVSKLREDRICMVQTVSQYEFLHKAALVAVACMRTTLNIHEFSDRLKILEEMNPLRVSKTELEFNVRDQHIQISVTTTAPGNNDQKEHSTIFYFLPGYKHKDQYVTTKLPISQPEAIELWKTITHNNIQLLVAFEVDPVKEQNDVNYVTHLKFFSTQIEPKKWLEIAKKIRVCSSHTGGKMLFMCSYGVSSSGFMAVVSLLLDRVDNESYLSVPMVVGAIRSIHPKILTSLEQYQLLYHIIKRHKETSAEYTNIEFTNYHNVDTLISSSAQKENENEINRTDQSETLKNDEINKTDDINSDLFLYANII